MSDGGGAEDRQEEGPGLNRKPEIEGVVTYSGTVYRDAPRNVYWEMTIACDLVCKHCRADAIPHRDCLELTTEEGKGLMDDVKAMYSGGLTHFAKGSSLAQQGKLQEAAAEF